MSTGHLGPLKEEWQFMDYVCWRYIFSSRQQRQTWQINIRTEAFILRRNGPLFLGGRPHPHEKPPRSHETNATKLEQTPEHYCICIYCLSLHDRFLWDILCVLGLYLKVLHLWEATQHRCSTQSANVWDLLIEGGFSPLYGVTRLYEVKNTLS